MSSKRVSFEIDEDVYDRISRVSALYGITVDEFISNALSEYLRASESDPNFRLTALVGDVCAEEKEEVLREIGNMSEDDLRIVLRKHFSV